MSEWNTQPENDVFVLRIWCTWTKILVFVPYEKHIHVSYEESYCFVLTYILFPGKIRVPLRNTILFAMNKHMSSCEIHDFLM